MSYRPHDSFIAPAQARSEPWRVAVGYILVMAVELGLIYTLFAVVAQMIGQDLAMSAFEGVFVHSVTSSDTLLLLASFVFMALGTVVVTVQLHRRGPQTLIGPLPRAVRDFLLTVRALAALLVILWVFLPETVELQTNLALRQWIVLLPLALPALLIQTGAEELLFRGYLQQQLAAHSRNPLIWMGLPALLFAWGHYTPGTAGENAWMMAAWAAAFSIVAADLTARTGTLGAAIGLHFANNAQAILIASYPGPASGLALYLYPESLSTALTTPEMIVEFAALGVMWLATRLALRV